MCERIYMHMLNTRGRAHTTHGHACTRARTHTEWTHTHAHSHTNTTHKQTQTLTHIYSQSLLTHTRTHGREHARHTSTIATYRAKYIQVEYRTYTDCHYEWIVCKIQFFLIDWLIDVQMQHEWNKLQLIFDSRGSPFTLFEIENGLARVGRSFLRFVYD